MQEYKERTERIKELREEFTTASTDLQTLTTAVEEKKVRCTLSQAHRRKQALPCTADRQPRQHRQLQGGA